jgi:hypothetical protein
MGKVGASPCWSRAQYLNHSRKEQSMPILLWLLGIPIPLIILIMLLHH